MLAPDSRSKSDPSLTLATVQRYLPEATTITSFGTPPIWQVSDSSGQSIALACMTSPPADKIVGYAGPNNVLLVMDLQGRVTQTHWLDWLDTQDHVERVRANDSFWQQFIGRSLGTGNDQPVDGVSGATLTSLAIAEGIDLRLSGKRPSLRFPLPITIEEVQSFFPETASVAESPHSQATIDAFSEKGSLLGRVLRTGPLADDKMGYQGPVELLVALDSQDRIILVKLRNSFDNEPYVRYSRMEASFWARFVGRTLNEISQIDLEAEGIEGVSGATMTSMAAADTLVTAAKRHYVMLSEAEAEMTVVRKWNWSFGEILTAMLAILVVPWSLSRLRGNRHWRKIWQAFALVVIVVMSGNLISMALLAGWTRSSLPMTLAPGLCLLVVVSLVMPMFFGRNVYCDHVCPHGMLQQFLARITGRHRQPTGQLVQLQRTPASEPNGGSPTTSGAQRGQRPLIHRALQGSAFIILLLSIGWVIWTVPSQLTFFEPFDVYAWRIGLSVSLAVWLASICLVTQIPMGYCRLACPTGMLLESVRRTRASRRWRLADMLLLALTAGVWLAVVMR